METTQEQAVYTYSIEKGKVLGKFADFDTAAAASSKVKGEKIYFRNETELGNNLSLTEMVIMLSKIAPEGTSIPKKFSDKPSGGKRIMDVIRAMEFKPARKAKGRIPTNPLITLLPKPAHLRGFQKDSVRGKINGGICANATANEDGSRTVRYNELEAACKEAGIDTTKIKACLQKMKEIEYIKVEEA